MRVDLLGPLRVASNGTEVEIGAAKERSLVAALALSPATAISADALIGALWGDRPPASARKTLQTYVSNLRRALGETAIETVSGGYLLRVDRDDVDISRFRRLVREGEDALRSGSPDVSRQAFGEALALWRGEPLAGVATHSGIAAAVTRLTEEYLSAVETRVAADLAAGRHHALPGELEELIRAHPFRERLWGHLMLALYRSGRQAEALAVFQRARAVLVDELGLEPGGELRRLEQAILRHDPELDPPHQVSGTPRPETARTPVRYAVCGDGVHIAYQIVGDGPVDIIAVPGFVSHLDLWWDAPTDHLVRQLASFSRLILFDKRGMGLSDRPGTVDIEHWVEDAVAVLDAVGSTRAVVLGVSAGAPTAALLAATHPERTQALALYGGYARLRIATEAPEDLASFARHMADNWGTGAGISRYAPSRARDPEAREYWARYQRISASPSAAALFFDALARVDVRHALPTIDVPTLVLHATRDEMVPLDSARELASLIPGAHLVALDSDVHLIWLTDVVDEITDQIQKFIEDAVRSDVVDRVLTTAVAIETSTGPVAWDGATRSIVERARGRLLEAAGAATFDGPVRAIHCAIELLDELGTRGRPARAGVHSGECRFTARAVAGAALDIARQLARRAPDDEVLVSQTIRDLVITSRVQLDPRDVCEFDGVPGTWATFVVQRRRNH